MVLLLVPVLFMSVQCTNETITMLEAVSLNGGKRISRWSRHLGHVVLHK